MDLVQLRWNCGGIEYRSRETEKESVLIPDSYGERQEFNVVTDKWGPWHKIEAVKGDESDKRFEANPDA